MGYFARERLFTGCGPNLPQSAVVYGADDLTEDECRTLAESVQHFFDKLHDDGGHGPWNFELAPSAAENPAAFISLKSGWNLTRDELESYRESSSNSWQAEVYWFYSVAAEHADIIRGLRDGRLPTVFLQCDSGHGFETFDCVDCLTFDEIETLESVLSHELYEMGATFRVVTDWHAEREPTAYVQARLSWNRLQENLKNDEADDLRVAASNAACDCIEEIKLLRQKPVVFGRGAADDSEEDEPDRDSQRLLPAVTKADEALRAGYRFPDNYWRNVWLYEQRKAGKTNAVILAELATKAQEFAPLESENALRNAIDSIAIHHHWPILKGKAGRPRAGGRDG